MSEYLEDSKKLSLQNAAFQAREWENTATDQYTAGIVSEKECFDAMEATRIAVEFAVSKGVSWKDLPAV